jgi:hypothetical protein
MGQTQELLSPVRRVVQTATAEVVMDAGLEIVAAAEVLAATAEAPGNKVARKMCEGAKR